MDGEKLDYSAFLVPGTMEDLTLLGTPLPQATSTATKKQYSYIQDNSVMTRMMEECEKYDEEIKKKLDLAALISNDQHTDIELHNEKTKQQTSKLDDVYKNINEMKDKFAEELAKMKATQFKSPISPVIVDSLGKYTPTTSVSFIEREEEEAINRFLRDNSAGTSNQVKTSSLNNGNIGDKEQNMMAGKSLKDFDFLVPSVPKKRTDKVSSEANKNTNTKTSEIRDANDDYLHDLPEKLSTSLSAAKISNQQRNNDCDRFSISSSADSSLGIISAEMIEGVKNKPLIDFSVQDKLDLSQRLAKHLSLDTSLVADCSLDISALASARMKETLAAKLEENKENKSSEHSDSSGYSTLVPGYSSDSSVNSKNNTAKEISRMSLSSVGETDLPVKEISFNMQKKPLGERNSLSSGNSFVRTSTNSGRLSLQSEGKQSVGCNPFGDYSKMSICSDEFRSGEDATDRLKCDEEAWYGEMGHGNQRSLSGIYGDMDLSTRTNDEKLSISSFLRSGSGPLGCLEKRAEQSQRPDFGRPVVSPVKKSKAKPILPPPEEKPTFIVSDEPSKDTAEEAPWNPQTLIDQYSMIHADNDDSDVSVPSLSCIGDLLLEVGDNFTPREVMEKLMAASRNRSKKTSKNQKKAEESVVLLDASTLSNRGGLEKVKTITTAVAGGTSFCRGYEADRSTRYSSSFNSHLSLEDDSASMSHHRNQAAKHPNLTGSVVTIDDSVAQSICNVTDFDGETEEYVCVLSPESMDFDIFNSYSTPQVYTISKACYINGNRQDSAALIHLPVNKLILQPGEERVISVTVAALVGETIKIKLEVTRTDLVTQEMETNFVFGKLVAELPKIAVVSSSSVDMKPAVDSYCSEFFGEFKEIIELKNNGHSVVPVKLTLTQMNCNNMDIFYFNAERHKTLTVRLEPGETFKQTVFCQTPAIFEISKSSGEVPVAAQVDIQLATSAQVQLPALSSISLTARLNPNFFCAPSSLSVTSDGPVPCKLFNSGPSSVLFQASTTTDYVVQPTAFTIHPRQSISLLVTYLGGPNRRGTLTLHAVETYTMYSISLRGRSPSASYNSSFITPQSSRAPSPTSPCSSISAHDEELMLACTHKELVWGGCALQQRSTRMCTIKNQNTHREKLLLKITDSNKCFKLLNDKKVLEQEVKMSLQPMESRQVCVVVQAGNPGPKWGYLTITRINSPWDKKVLPLYAFGGKAKVAIEGILQDPEQHMWLYLDPVTLRSSFSLTNTGDSAAFVKISEGMTATTVGGGLSIAPPEQCLQPGHFVSVEISLSVTPERLEYLLEQTSQTICITRLTVTHGDESTRLRLSRLSRVDAKLASKLTSLNSLPSTHIQDLDKLGDHCGCAEALWLEDVKEWTIGVLVKRSALEALRLDTTFEFVDLATTVIH